MTHYKQIKLDLLTEKQKRKNLIIPFSLSQLEINSMVLFEDIKPSFLNLSVDRYDTHLSQIQFLKQNLPTQVDKLERLFFDYYTGKTSNKILNPFLDLLSTDKIELFNKIVPFRRRAIAQFHLTYANQQWSLENISANPFIQKTDSYLKIPRFFESIDTDITQHPSYQQLIFSIANLTRNKSGNNKMTITIHHIHSFITDKNQRVSNSPEGIHQDGADFIVSALVLERYNVMGGVSRIYDEDKETLLLETSLKAGEGIFQPDHNSPLWHEVTPISLENPNLSGGYRSIIGFDISLEK